MKKEGFIPNDKRKKQNAATMIHIECIVFDHYRMQTVLEVNKVLFY